MHVTASSCRFHRGFMSCCLRRAVVCLLALAISCVAAAAELSGWLAVNFQAASAIRAGRFAEGEQIAQTGLHDCPDSGVDGTLCTSIFLQNIGDAQNGLGRIDEAIASHQRSLAVRRTGLPAPHPLTAESALRLGTLLQQNKRSADAVAPLAEAVTLYKMLGPRFDERLRVSYSWELSALASLRRAAEQADVAIDAHRQAISWFGAGSDASVRTANIAAPLLLDAGQPRRALDMAVETLTAPGIAAMPAEPRINLTIYAVRALRKLDQPGPVTREDRAAIDNMEGTITRIAEELAGDTATPPIPRGVLLAEQQRVALGRGQLQRSIELGQRAVTLLRDAPDWRPKLIDAYRDIAMAYAGLGDAQGMIDAVEDAVVVPGDSAPIAAARASMFASVGVEAIGIHEAPLARNWADQASRIIDHFPADPSRPDTLLRLAIVEGLLTRTPQDGDRAATAAERARTAATSVVNAAKATSLLGDARRFQDRAPEAESLCHEAQTTLSREPDATAGDVTLAMLCEGRAQNEQGHWQQAERTLAGAAALLAAKAPSMTVWQVSIEAARAQALTFLGQYDEALAALQLALDQVEAGEIMRSTAAAEVLATQGTAFLRKGDYAASKAAFARSGAVLDQLGDSSGDSTMMRVRAVRGQGLAAFNLGDFPAATGYFEEASRLRQQKLGPAGWEFAESEGDLARVYAATGRMADAVTHQDAAIASYWALMPESAARLTLALTSRAGIATAAGDAAAAEHALSEAVTVSEQAQGTGSPKTAQLRLALIDWLERNGRGAEAGTLRDETLAALAASYAASSPERIAASLVTVNTLQAVGRVRDAAAALGLCGPIQNAAADGASSQEIDLRIACGTADAANKLASGQWTAARAVAADIVALAEHAGAPRALIAPLLVQARAEAAAGNAPGVRTASDRLLDVLARAQAPETERAWVHVIIGQLLVAAGDRAGAEAEFRAALEAGGPDGAPGDPGRLAIAVAATDGLAQLLIGRGQTGEAQASWETAHPVGSGPSTDCVPEPRISGNNSVIVAGLRSSIQSSLPPSSMKYSRRRAIKEIA